MFNSIGTEWSVYFKVFTSIESATEKNTARPKKPLLNFDDTKRDRKAEMSPKELKEVKSLIAPNIMKTSYLKDNFR